VSDDAFAAEFMNDYFAECAEHLANVRHLLLDLDARDPALPVPAAAIEELFRSFHSIKGVSGMVGLREAEALAHHMEDYLRTLRQRDTRLTAEGVDALAAGVDTLERVLAARRDDRPLPAVDDAVARLDAVVASTAGTRPDQVGPEPATGSTGAGEPIWRITFTPSPALLARGINVDRVRARLRETGEIVDASPRVVAGAIAFEFLFSGTLSDEAIAAWREEGLTVEPAQARDVTAVPAAAAPRDAAPAVGPAHVVRVDLARLDDLMRMIGELVISRARLDDALARVEKHVPAVEWRDVQENTQTIERQLRDLREGVMRVRLVPVGEILRRVPFVVRDLARDSGKRVRLDLRGHDTEIDKFLIERMMDPVLHLVRNAVSHAIETTDERIAAGKPPEGTLTLAASSLGDIVVLEVADDGRGIDEAAVVARARQIGLEVPDPPLDRARLLDLISAPGFSTREETDRASGRGVGMAVVMSTVTELNGRITLSTTPGTGTRFVIELPLTLAITDALVAHVGDRTFAVPQGSVREVIELDPAALRRVERHELAPFRGGSLPILRLSDVFGVAPRPGRALHAFVVGSGSDAVGIAVDRISGQREIVVRAMDDSLIKVDGVTGATDLGDGRAVLILDLPGLVRRQGAAAAVRGAEAAS
jgi:two-component system chemotaxis sensor kinase CheA